MLVIGHLCCKIDVFVTFNELNSDNWVCFEGGGLLRATGFVDIKVKSEIKGGDSVIVTI